MTNKKQFEDLKATELLDTMNMICEYCDNKKIDEGMNGCRICPLRECCTSLGDDPSEWNTYDLRKMIEAYLEECE